MSTNRSAPAAHDVRGPDDAVGNLCSEVVELEDGTSVQICQQNAGPGIEVGGGEFADPDTGPAVHARGDARPDERGIVDPVDGLEKQTR
jgi:hypothetical protein